MPLLYEGFFEPCGMKVESFFHAVDDFPETSTGDWGVQSHGIIRYRESRLSYACGCSAVQLPCCRAASVRVSNPDREVAAARDGHGVVPGTSSGRPGVQG